MILGTVERHEWIQRQVSSFMQVTFCLLSEPGPGIAPEQMTEQAFYRMNLANWLMRWISYPGRAHYSVRKHRLWCVENVLIRLSNDINKLFVSQLELHLSITLRQTEPSLIFHQIYSHWRSKEWWKTGMSMHFCVCVCACVYCCCTAISSWTESFCVTLIIQRFWSVSGSQGGSGSILINLFFIIKLGRFWCHLCSPDSVYYLTLETDINKYEKHWGTSSSVWAGRTVVVCGCLDLLVCLGRF